MTQHQVPDNSNQTPFRRALMRAGTAIVLVAIMIALGTSLYRSGTRAAQSGAPASRSEIPLMTRDGSRITVPEGSPLRTKLTVEAVAAKEIQRKLVLPAVVEADPAATVKVLPPLAGRVIDLKVQLGGRVTQGQVLAVIDSSDLAQAYADDSKARSALKLTTQALDRLLVLEKSRAIAVKDREQAQSDHAQAQAEMQRAESRLKAIGVSAEQPEQSQLLSMKAPVSGSIIDLQIGPGAYLNDPTAAIMTIANLDTIWVTANVPEKDTALVVKDQAVDVVFTAYPSETFKGQVLFVSDILDPDTRRTRVRVAFRNSDLRLKPNMFANATFLAPQRMVPIIPTTALVLREENDHVFVETAPWVFEPRRVEIGFQEGDHATVSSGLKAGERVVVKGGVLLND
jgi:membrane fusion protein, heavy metal efflux system